jgi:ParB family transcriptional regulator, chromosome partitioning protein
MEVRNVSLSDITVSNNRRKASKSAVEQLAASILEIGLQNPIGLTTNLRMIHGRHRFEAYKLLQRTEIPASIHDIDDIHAELAEIDENIQRHQLSKAEECKALARRKELYLSLHPETKRGAKGGRPRQDDDKYEVRPMELPKKLNANIAVSFVDDTVSKTGRSKRSVETDVALGNSLPDDIVDKIADTPVANNKSELKKLAKLAGDEQRVVADLLADGEVSSVTEALATQDEPASEPEPSEILKARVLRVIDKWRVEYRASHTLAAAVLESLVEILLSVHDQPKKRR